MEIRDEIETFVKVHQINRENFQEVSKQAYQNILNDIEAAFVDKSRSWCQGIHWCNLGAYKDALPVLYKTKKVVDYVELLPDIIPSDECYFYFLVEGNKNYEPKYWLYEERLTEIIMMINEVVTSDFYIASKKYEWMISENHHDVWSFVGNGLKLDCLEV